MRPSTIIRSACRREAKPACERIFWSRSSAIFFFGGTGLGGTGFLAGLWLFLFRRLSRRFDIRKRHAADLFELLQRRQLGKVLESKLDQELLGGLVENRFADDVLAAGHRD